MTKPVLGPELEAFLREPVTMIIGSADASRRASACYAVGNRLDRVSSRIVVVVDRRLGARVIENLAERPAVALVVCRPGTFRTVQFKGNDARLEAIAPEDAQSAVRYVERMVIELGNIGDEPHWVRAAFALDPQALTAISFTPSELYTQTPGADAGARIA